MRTSKLALMLATVLVTAFTSVSPTQSQPARTEPWREPQDAGQAITDPDAYAWRLFVALNWPADPAAKAANPKMRFGTDGPVVWETWKNAREVFLRGGAEPGPWLSAPAPASLTAPNRFDTEALQQQIRRQLLGPNVKFDPAAAERQVNETRLNKETFEFIRRNALYHLDGQLVYFASAQRTLSFEAAAKEIKAQWREISGEEKPRYHWVEAQVSDGTKKTYGLTALHITTKDLPNWFWATFEHADNPTKTGNEPWLLPSHDTFACKNKAPDCGEAPTGLGLEGTKWANYRLRGTQIDFTDNTGRPTLLANSQPEQGFQETSSCISCHARASIGLIGDRPARLSIFKRDGAGQSGTVEGYIGPIQEDWYSTDAVGGREVLYKPLDFVWSLFRAQPKAP